MPGAIKLNESSHFDSTMNYKIIKAWVYGMDNYYKLLGLTDEVWQARFAATLMIKNAALWVGASGLDLDATK